MRTIPYEWDHKQMKDLARLRTYLETEDFILKQCHSTFGSQNEGPKF